MTLIIINLQLLVTNWIRELGTLAINVNWLYKKYVCPMKRTCVYDINQHQINGYFPANRIRKPGTYRESVKYFESECNEKSQKS